MRKTKERMSVKEVIGYIIFAIIFVLAIMLPQPLSYYMDYKKAEESRELSVTYDSFYDFLRNWDGDLNFK